MPLTNFVLQDIISFIFGGATFSVPGTFYLAFSSTTPVQAKGSTTPYWNFTEPSVGTGGYARLSVTNNGSNFGTISSEPTSGYSIQNAAAITMPASTAAWSTGTTPLTYAGFWDASTAGNLWAYGLISPALTVSTGGIAPTFTVGQVVATFQ